MILLYNLVQLCSLVLLSPLLLTIAVLSSKYRLRVLQRLGLRGRRALRQKLAAIRRDRQKTIWVHALSVGEVASARPLVEAIHRAFPEHLLIFSATTRTGEDIAQQTLAAHVDLFVPFPLDFLPAVHRLARLIQPDLFILVETDFWPNFLQYLKKQQIPALLVNGRISQRSFARYQRLRAFFRPLFSAFAYLGMQTGEDAEKMRSLGVPPEKNKTLGNLKFAAAMPQPTRSDPAPPGRPELLREFGIPAGKTILAVGSTHPGEEEVVLAVYEKLAVRFPDLYLILAPRRPERRNELLALAQRHHLSMHLRTRAPQGAGESAAHGLILDTIGELATIYRLCDIAFVGGSLVAEGGHNPLEPAAHGKPVLFGPHMDDFREISAELLEKKAAVCCGNGEELLASLTSMLANETARQLTGTRARAVVEAHQGIIETHLRLIRTLLEANS